MTWSFDILSAIIGAVCVAVPMMLIILWVSKESYKLGHQHAHEGKWIGDE